jgi:hypothetical protein
VEVIATVVSRIDEFRICTGIASQTVKSGTVRNTRGEVIAQFDSSMQTFHHIKCHVLTDSVCCTKCSKLHHQLSSALSSSTSKSKPLNSFSTEQLIQEIKLLRNMVETKQHKVMQLESLLQQSTVEVDAETDEILHKAMNTFNSNPSNKILQLLIATKLTESTTSPFARRWHPL